MSTSSRSYKGHYYNAEDERITDELRRAESARQVRQAGIDSRRGLHGADAQIIALCDWVKILVGEGKIDAARRLRTAIRRMNAQLDAADERASRKAPR
jgi:hypothetical protein